MKKIAILLTALLLLASETAQPANKVVREADGKSTQMRIGHTDGNMALNLGLGGMAVIIQGAIQFPAEYMQKVAGSKITTVRLAIGCELSEQNNYIFITNDLNKPFTYKQTVEKLEKGWNDIRLDTPFDVTGEELFIGFRYCSSGTPLSLDGREMNNQANWIRLLQSDDQPDIAWQHQDGGCHNLQAILEGDGLPQHDVEVQKLVAKRYAQTGGKAPINLIVRNMAASDINSLEVACTIEGEEPVVYTVDQLNIASNDVAFVKVGDITFEKNGIYNLDVQINKVNGAEDENAADNSGKVENIIAKKEYTNRKVLLEHFSTMNCPNCPSAHKTIDDALLYRDDIIHVTHHAGMGTDPLSLPESEKYFFFYQGLNGGSIYAPGAMLDRTNLAPYGAGNGSDGGSPGPVFFPNRDYFSKLADQRLSTHAFVTLDIEKEYDEASRTLTVTVAGEVPSGDVSKLKGNDYRVNIFLTEDSIQCKDYPQNGLGTTEEGKNFYHNSTLRKMVTDVWGDAIGFENAAYRSKTYTCTLPEEWVDKQMHVVAFLTNLDANNSNNCPVYNANTVRVINEGAAGIDTPISHSEETMGVYAAGSELYVKGEYHSARIYNTSGQCVQTVSEYQETIGIQALPQGLYFISLETESGMQTHKFIKK